MIENNTVFQIRINDKELLEIKACAKLCGNTVAGYIKTTMKKENKKLIAKANK